MLHTLSPSLLTIDLAALAENYGFFRQKVGPSCAVAGIVKADAYGLGAVSVARALHARGCRFFFTATPGEALAVRAALNDPGTVLAVLGGVYHGAERDYAAQGLAPVLNSLEEIARWKKAAPGAPALIHFDTGMSRLGLAPDETDILLREPQRIEGMNIPFIMSHLACADAPDHPMTGAQRETFDAIARAFPGVKKSLANSAGIFHGNSFHYDMVRPGIAIYGGAPLEGRDNPMRPVARLETRVLQLRAVREGQSAGYGASYVFARDGMAATVALGYADGFLRSLSNRGKLWWRGRPLPIAGRVSMDLVILDLTGLDGEMPGPGDFVEVLGPHQDADALAAAAGTISYEILTSLGRRYERRYLPATL